MINCNFGKWFFFFIEKPIFENHENSLSPSMGLLKAKKILPLVWYLIFYARKPNRIGPSVDVGWTWIYVLCQFKKNDLSVLENSNDDDSKWSTKIYAFILLHHVCILLPIIVNQNCILSDANSVGFTLSFSKSLWNLNTSETNWKYPIKRGKSLLHKSNCILLRGVKVRHCTERKHR